MNSTLPAVIPAEAGIHARSGCLWIPVSAGMAGS